MDSDPSCGEMQDIFCPYEELGLDVQTHSKTFDKTYYRVISKLWRTKLCKIEKDFSQGRIDAETEKRMISKSTLARDILICEKRKEVFDKYKYQGLESAWEKLREIDRLVAAEKSAECMVKCLLDEMSKLSDPEMIEHYKRTLFAIIYVHGTDKFDKWAEDSDIQPLMTNKSKDISAKSSAPSSSNLNLKNVNDATSSSNQQRRPIEVQLILKMLQLNSDIKGLLKQAQSTASPQEKQSWKELLSLLEKLVDASELAMHSSLNVCASTNATETTKSDQPTPTKRTRCVTTMQAKRTKLV